MVVQVRLEVMFLREGLGAQLTGVRLDPGMQSHVQCHVTSVGEGFSAHAARERLLTSVDTQVLLKEHLAREGLAAMRARVRTFAWNKTRQ